VFAGCQLVESLPFAPNASAADSGAHAGDDIDVSEPVQVGIGHTPELDSSDAGAECEDGAARCAADGGSVERCQHANWKEAERCHGDKPSCRAHGRDAACVACTPGGMRCLEDGARQVCDADGGGWSTRASVPCGSCGGELRCDGSCSQPTPRKLGTACGSCGGRVQCDDRCSVPTPEDFGRACGPCGGIVQCDGSCTVAYPDHYGDACGACGGAVQCDGSCSVATPPNFGAACGTCGGVVRCDGSCSRDAPANLGAACGSCGGVTQCDGTCSTATPANYGQACGMCGGTIQCDSNCSVNAPPNYGQACGMCGGTVQCNGMCSIATPADYGMVAMDQDVASSGLIIGGFTGLSTSVDALDPEVFRACPRGSQRAGEPMLQNQSERGSCEAEWASDDPHDCRVRVNFEAGLLDVNLTCEVTIHYQVGCAD
jgi:hypothetical protein